MAADREAILSAVATLVFGATFLVPVGGATTWVTKSRRLRLWGDVPPTSQPACYLVDHDEQVKYQGRGHLGVRELEMSLVCYARTDSAAVVGSTLISSMLTAVEASLAPVGGDRPDGAQTLGGLVSWCRIEGRVFKDPGDIDTQALLVVPIRAMWP